MKSSHLLKKYNLATAQRNRITFLLGASGILNIILSLSVFNLIGNEKIIIAPPVVNQEFWVASNEFSDGYIEQMSAFISSLLLNVTPHNFSSRLEQVLKHVAPKSYAQIKAELTKHQDEIEQKGLSTVYYPQSFKIDRAKLLVRLKGQLTIALANTALNAQQKEYEIKYLASHGRLLIQSFKEISENEK